MTPPPSGPPSHLRCMTMTTVLISRNDLQLLLDLFSQSAPFVSQSRLPRHARYAVQPFLRTDAFDRKTLHTCQDIPELCLPPQEGKAQAAASWNGLYFPSGGNQEQTGTIQIQSYCSLEGRHPLGRRSCIARERSNRHPHDIGSDIDINLTAALTAMPECGVRCRLRHDFKQSRAALAANRCDSNWNRRGHAQPQSKTPK